MKCAYTKNVYTCTQKRTWIQVKQSSIINTVLLYITTNRKLSLLSLSTLQNFQQLDIFVNFFFDFKMVMQFHHSHVANTVNVNNFQVAERLQGVLQRIQYYTFLCKQNISIVSMCIYLVSSHHIFSDRCLGYR